MSGDMGTPSHDSHMAMQMASGSGGVSSGAAVGGGDGLSQVMCATSIENGIGQNGLDQFIPAGDMTSTMGGVGQNGLRDFVSQTGDVWGHMGEGGSSFPQSTGSAGIKHDGAWALQTVAPNEQLNKPTAGATIVSQGQGQEH